METPRLPGEHRITAVGATWVVSKSGGMNKSKVKSPKTAKVCPALKLLCGSSWIADSFSLLGEGRCPMGRNRQKSTMGATAEQGHSSRESYAEITSGKTTCQQGLATTCKDYGRPTNYRGLWQFFRSVRRIWKKWLNRRTRGKALNWDEFAHLLSRHPLLRPRITRSWS
jgi:hypothetical protein